MPRHLPVYSASNSASTGAPWALGGPSFSYTVVQIEPDPNDPLLAIRSEIGNQTAPHPPTAGDPIPGAPTPEQMHQPLEQAFEIGSGIGLGLDTIKSTGVSKNNLTVGAMYTGQDVSDATSDIIGLSHFSSRGPIDDGRVKPDLVAPSTFEPLTPYSFNFGGTSSAAPAVTGTLALLQEINSDGGGPRFLSSTWKALLLNTAIDATDLSYLIEQNVPGSTSEYEFVRVESYFGIEPQVPGANDNDPLLVGPDYFFGWGLVDAEAAAQLLVNNLRSESGAAHLCEHTLFDQSNDVDDSNNLVVEIPFEHDGEAAEIRAMLCWTDPPFQQTQIASLTQGNFDPETGSADDPNVPKNLVNDLDLWIVDPNGNMHRPWVLDRNAPLSPATRDPNTTNDIDNVEQVVIDTPIPGTYTLKVSHKGKLQATELIFGTDQYQQVSGREQHFSLVISGNLDPSPRRPSLEYLGKVPSFGNSEYIAFILDGFVGLHYQLESSSDLINWTEEIEVIGQQLPSVAITAQEPFPFAIIQQPRREARFYRVKEVVPPNQTND